MSTIDILREAEGDLAALASLPGEIRDKVKAGVTELTRLRDAIDAAIAGLTGSAQATLDSLRPPTPASAAPDVTSAANTSVPAPAPAA